MAKTFMFDKKGQFTTIIAVKHYELPEVSESPTKTVKGPLSSLGQFSLMKSSRQEERGMRTPAPRYP